MWEWLIPGGISLLSSIFGGTQEAPQISAEDINKLINQYRKAGLAGIEQLGIQERQNATNRLAASGLEPSLGLQQSLFNPILDQLGQARAKLEGNLAGVQGNLMVNNLQAQGQGYSNLTNLFSGIGDLAGLFALSGFNNWTPDSGGDGNSYSLPTDDWFKKINSTFGNDQWLNYMNTLGR